MPHENSTEIKADVCAEAMRWKSPIKKECEQLIKSLIEQTSQKGRLVYAALNES